MKLPLSLLYWTSVVKPICIFVLYVLLSEATTYVGVFLLISGVFYDFSLQLFNPTLSLSLYISLLALL